MNSESFWRRARKLHQLFKNSRNEMGCGHAIISRLNVRLVSGINIGLPWWNFGGLCVIYVDFYSFCTRGSQEKWSVHQYGAPRNTHEQCVYGKLISLFYSMQRDMMHYNQPDTSAWQFSPLSWMNNHALHAATCLFASFLCLLCHSLRPI